MESNIVNALRTVVHRVKTDTVGCQSERSAKALEQVMVAIIELSNIEVQEGRRSLLSPGRFGVECQQPINYDYADDFGDREGAGLHSQHIKKIHTETLFALWLHTNRGTKPFTKFRYAKTMMDTAVKLGVELTRPGHTFRSLLLHDLRARKHLIQVGKPTKGKTPIYKLSKACKHINHTRLKNRNTTMVFIREEARASVSH